MLLEFCEPVWRPLRLVIVLGIRCLLCVMLSLTHHCAVTTFWGKRLLDTKALTHLYNKCYHVKASDVGISTVFILLIHRARPDEFLEFSYGATSLVSDMHQFVHEHADGAYQLYHRTVDLNAPTQYSRQLSDINVFTAIAFEVPSQTSKLNSKSHPVQKRTLKLKIFDENDTARRFKFVYDSNTVVGDLHQFIRLSLPPSISDFCIFDLKGTQLNSEKRFGSRLFD